MKLEIKHIIPYFPYGLKGNAIDNDWDIKEINQKVFRIETGGTKKSPNNYEPFLIVGDSEIGLDGFSPFLHPLSDLMKDIMVNGDVGINKHDIITLKNIIENKDVQQYQNLQYSTILYLCKHHYDFQLLIEKGLALEINDEN